MTISKEDREDIEAAPAALRKLIESELGAGNSIVEVGHSHPAPPAGAYFRLANKVTTRPRASDHELLFYERNSSLYSGEFTNAAGFYFVIEPPNPPPPESDMDSIRKALSPQPDPFVQLAQRRARIGAEHGAPLSAVTSAETPTGRTHLLHFRNARAPHAIQFALERDLMTLFTIEEKGGELKLHATAIVVGARYEFELQFLAALAAENCYSLSVSVSWADADVMHHAYFRTSSASWIEMWTRELEPARPPALGESLQERYRELAEAALQAEAHLDCVAAVQAAIIDGMKRGGRYANSHKEGGTNIIWRLDRFVRSDYGDDRCFAEFKTEIEFLAMLRQFCHWEATRHQGERVVPELDIWKLILRQMIA